MSQEEIVAYWLEKAEQDVESAKENFSAGRLQNSVRDAYFACFLDSIPCILSILSEAKRCISSFLLYAPAASA